MHSRPARCHATRHYQQNGTFGEGAMNSDYIIHPSAASPVLRTKLTALSNMARPQKRFRGVRQRHWGSWVSEIRHPLLKTRIWLGTFETAYDAARAYDEAARLMCGAVAKTNFSHGPNGSSPVKCKYLSATLHAKLHRFNLQSVQAAQPTDSGMPLRKPSSPSVSVANSRSPSEGSFVEVNPALVGENVEVSCLEECHVEQMIEELLDSNLSMELCFTAL
ncbi:hypothetical protein ZIOFF_023986 [Zingiber officinale]|uniref:AP2/ERF domain-containing protein n=2 Tax=Zingiber officinale TaxID=94328 RepID=A0A8J5GSW1_ZINOF|nr:hypothetical protein ZIOFF_023986 [Zingiber officinale]